LLLLWVFSAGAIDALDWNRRSTPLLAISWIALLATLSAVQTSSWHSPVLEDYLTNTLESVPRHAVLLGSGEQRTFGFVYAQKVLGVRPDVVFVDGTMIKRPWYRQRIERLLGIRIDAVASSPPGPSTIDTVRLVKNLLGSGRPLFMTDILSDRIVQAFPNYPWGTSVALLSQRHPQPSPGEVYQRNRELFARFRLRDLEGPKDVWTQTALDSYSRTWRTLAEFFERGGRFREAEDCKRRLTSFDREPPFGTVSPTNLP
jgi:hypothetical protein